jgi:hypothetical protein
MRTVKAACLPKRFRAGKSVKKLSFYAHPLMKKENHYQ